MAKTVKVSAYNMGDLSLIPRSGRYPGEGNGNLIQYFCMEKSHGRRSLVGYSSWGHKQSDTTERLHFTNRIIDQFIVNIVALRKFKSIWHSWKYYSKHSYNHHLDYVVPNIYSLPYYLPIHLCRLPRWLSGKESACQCRRCRKRGLYPWAGKSPRGGNGNPLHYSYLGNPMDRGSW